MSTAPTLRIESTKPEDTFLAGEKLAKTLKPGSLLQLDGDLGAGKTQFVRGLAFGLGSTDEVASPSFTISREYACEDGITLHHYDFYRLEDAGIMRDELNELIGDEKAIVAIEWAGIVEDIFPKDFYRIKITAGANESDRIIEITQSKQQGGVV